MVDNGELIALAENETLYTLIIRTVVLYLVIVIAVRLTGKRGIGQATAIDFILALAIGDIVGEMAYGTENLLNGVLIVAIWVLLHAITSYWRSRCPPWTRSSPGTSGWWSRTGPSFPGRMVVSS